MLNNALTNQCVAAKFYYVVAWYAVDWFDWYHLVSGQTNSEGVYLLELQLLSSQVLDYSEKDDSRSLIEKTLSIERSKMHFRELSRHFLEINYFWIFCCSLLLCFCVTNLTMS